MLTAHKPKRSDYADWDGQKFTDDSIAWAINPLYGWIDKNPKADGSKYDIYNDGLRIYTTIDSRMQQYAEEAVGEHMRKLQASFAREKRNSSTAPYSSNPAELSAQTRAKLIANAVRQSERRRVPSLVSLRKPPPRISSPIPLLTNPPTPTSWPWHSSTRGHRAFT